jgi:NitT/TauT family transport system substrate-binding protein
MSVHRCSRAFARLCLLAGVLAGVLGMAASTPVEAATRLRFQLDWRLEGSYAAFFLAKAKGYFQQEGLDVTIDAGSGGAGTISRVAAGTYDMGIGEMGSLVEFISQHLDDPQAQIRAVSIFYDTTPATVFALRKSGIVRPADLVGRTLGAPVADTGRKTWPIFAAAVGLPVDAVKWQSIDPALRETSLIRGDVDAITGFYHTVVPNLLARGVAKDDIVALRYADNGVPLYGSALIVSAAFLRNEPQAVRGFLRAFARGMKESIADPEAAVRFVRAQDPILDEKLEVERLRMLIEASIATPGFRAAGIGGMDRRRMEETIRLIAGAFALKAVPAPDQVFDTAFLPPLEERRLP